MVEIGPNLADALKVIAGAVFFAVLAFMVFR